MADSPPFRAEHIGSLLRPKELREAHRAHAAGKLDAASFEQAQDRAIADIVAFQEKLGFRVVTDGEFRRASYWMHFIATIDGFTVGESLFRFRDDSGRTLAFTAPEVTGKLRRKRSASGHEFAFLAAHTK